MSEDNKTPEKTNTALVQPTGNRTKMIKIKAVRPIAIGGKLILPGTIAEATEEEVKEFCDTKFKGSYNFAGERYMGDGEMTRHEIVRAVRAS